MQTGAFVEEANAVRLRARGGIWSTNCNPASRATTLALVCGGIPAIGTPSLSANATRPRARGHMQHHARSPARGAPLALVRGGIWRDDFRIAVIFFTRPRARGHIPTPRRCPRLRRSSALPRRGVSFSLQICVDSVHAYVRRRGDGRSALPERPRRLAAARPSAPSAMRPCADGALWHCLPLRMPKGETLAAAEYPEPRDIARLACACATSRRGFRGALTEISFCDSINSMDFRLERGNALCKTRPSGLLPVAGTSSTPSYCWRMCC